MSPTIAADSPPAQPHKSLLLHRFQEECQRLTQENIKVEAELDRSKGDLRDINEFLTNQLKASSVFAAGLDAKIQELEVRIPSLSKSHEVCTALTCVSNLHCPFRAFLGGACS